MQLFKCLIKSSDFVDILFTFKFVEFSILLAFKYSDESPVTSAQKLLEILLEKKPIGYYQFRRLSLQLQVRQLFEFHCKLIQGFSLKDFLF